ncbi:Vacuolar protein sorting-associated protein vps5 [Malassezia brasiliensis]|uniref:Vacuolar protein sorting-associated protein vps5 n=1 Tax=Malassezia brasiliensis TaxID=1821822 RepID=A0AAF0DW44_9BASI|nr:Vacuolar protein sorting-associated protein vps5 [Malassezia brasiliensis]
MRVLVTGASGLLGRAVVAAAEARGDEVVGVAHSRAQGALRKLDLCDADAVRALLADVQPDAVIHTAAERRPDAMEAHPDEARRLNVDVPAQLVAACANLERPARLVHLSTDYVFDGAHPPYRPGDAPHPLNAYGQSKLDAEQAIANASQPGQATCVRVPVLYGDTEYDGESAVNVLLGALLQTAPAKMDAHGVRFPTNVADVARFLLAVCAYNQGPLPPILHFSATEAMTKYDMCLAMAAAWETASGAKVATDHLVPERAPDPNAATQRPGNCQLDTQASAALGLPMECVAFATWWREYLTKRGPPPPPKDANDAPADAPAASDDDEARYGVRSPTDTPAAALPPRDADAPRVSFSVRVCNPQRISDRVSSHVVYTVRVASDAPWLGGPAEWSALRRYSEFRWLHAALVHNHPGVVVPPLPEKVKLNNMKPDLVEFRRRALEQALQKMLEHPLLQKDEDLVLFLKSAHLSADIKARDAVKGAVVTPEQKTYLGWSQSLYNVRFHETDEWFNQQLEYLAQLEARLHDIVAAIHTLAQRRQELSEAQTVLYKHLVTLSGGALSRSVSTCFGALAELKKRNSEASTRLASHESHVLQLVFYEYERLIGSVRKAFATRIDVWHAWQRADDDLAKLKARHRRAATGHIDAQMRALSNAELVSTALQNRFEDVSALCKKEMQRFEREKVADLRAALAEYVHTFQHVQQELMDELAHCEGIVQRHVFKSVPQAAAARTDASGATADDSAAGQDVNNEPPEDSTVKDTEAEDLAKNKATSSEDPVVEAPAVKDPVAAEPSVASTDAPPPAPTP